MTDYRVTIKTVLGTVLISETFQTEEKAKEFITNLNAESEKCKRSQLDDMIDLLGTMLICTLDALYYGTWVNIQTTTILK